VSGGDLAGRLLASLDQRGAAPALTILSGAGPQQVLSGHDLARRCEDLAGQLGRWTGGRSVTLVLAFGFGESFVTLLLGCLLAGVTAVPVPVPRPGSRTDRFDHVIRDSGAAAVLCLPRHASLLSDRLQRLGPTPPLVPLPLDVATLPRLAPRHPDRASPAVIQYTSGSTALPRGVRVMPNNILANSDLVARHWQIDADARMLSWLPHHHDMGLMGGVLYPLLNGGSTALMDPLDFLRRPQLWLEAIDRQRASFSGGPAFALAELLERLPPGATTELDLSCWTRAFCGAEPVPPDILARIRARLAPAGLDDASVFECYGLAETTLFAAGLPGPPRDGYCALCPELRAGLAIVDPATDTEVPQGETGEIWLRGPSVADGYLDGDDGDKGPFRVPLRGGKADEWLRSGDLGAITPHGLRLRGRMKEVLICNGRKFSAAEIEQLACTGIDRRIHAAAAFAPDPAQAGKVVVVLEADAAGPGDFSEGLRRRLAGETGLELAGLTIVRRGRLPRTTSGKIRRLETAERWRTGRLHREALPCPR